MVFLFIHMIFGKYKTFPSIFFFRRISTLLCDKVIIELPFLLWCLVYSKLIYKSLNLIRLIHLGHLFSETVESMTKTSRTNQRELRRHFMMEANKLETIMLPIQK